MRPVSLFYRRSMSIHVNAAMASAIDIGLLDSRIRATPQESPGVNSRWTARNLSIVGIRVIDDERAAGRGYNDTGQRKCAATREASLAERRSSLRSASPDASFCVRRDPTRAVADAREIRCHSAAQIPGGRTCSQAREKIPGTHNRPPTCMALLLVGEYRPSLPTRVDAQLASEKLGSTASLLPAPPRAHAQFRRSRGLDPSLARRSTRDCEAFY